MTLQIIDYRDQFDALLLEEALLILDQIDPSKLTADQIKRARKTFDKITPSTKSLTADQLDRIAATRADLFEMATNRGVTAGMTKVLGKARSWYPAMTSEDFTVFIIKAIKGARLDPHYCGWNADGKVYSGWDNLLRDAARIERHAHSYDTAVATGNFVRRSINKTGRAGKESSLEVLKANPEAVFSTPESQRALAILSGASGQTQIAN